MARKTRGLEIDRIIKEELLKEMDNIVKLRYQQQIQQLNQSKMTNELKSKTEPKILEGLLSRLIDQNYRLNDQSTRIFNLKTNLIGPSVLVEEDPITEGSIDDAVTILDKINHELSIQQMYLREIDLSLECLDKLV